MLTVDPASVLATTAGLGAAPSVRVAAFARTTLGFFSTFDTAPEFLIASGRVRENALTVVATGRAERITQRARCRFFIRAAAFAKARSDPRTASGEGREAPAEAAGFCFAAGSAPALARSRGAPCAAGTTRIVACPGSRASTGAVKGGVGQEIEGFSTAARRYA